MDDDVPALSIGSVIGGQNPDAMRWKQAITSLGRRIRDERTDLRSPLNVNVVFHVPGSVRPELEFNGVRTGSYSNRARELIVQVALPYVVPGEPTKVLAEGTSIAIDEAERFAVEYGLADGLPELRDFAARLL